MVILFLNVIYLFIFLTVLGLHCCMGFSLVVKRRGYSLVVVRGLLIAVGCSGFSCYRAQASVVMVPRLVVSGLS